MQAVSIAEPGPLRLLLLQMLLFLYISNSCTLRDKTWQVFPAVRLQFEKLVSSQPTGFYNMSNICSILDKELPFVGLPTLLEQLYFRYSYEEGSLQNTTWPNKDIGIPWIQVMNHFLGAWSVERMGVQTVMPTLIQGGYFEGLHGAATFWGSRHPNLSCRSFWDALLGDFSRIDGHSIGHAVLMSALAQNLTACQYPTNFMSGFTTLPAAHLPRALSICQCGPQHLCRACFFGVFHSIRAYVSSWYATCNETCMAIEVYDAKSPCLFHCKHDFSDLSPLWDSHLSLFKDEMHQITQPADGAGAFVEAGAPELNPSS